MKHIFNEYFYYDGWLVCQEKNDKEWTFLEPVVGFDEAVEAAKVWESQKGVEYFYEKN